jgi:hypothetical protein
LRRALPLLLVAACTCLDDTPGVRQHGPVAPGSDAILSAAEARWPGLALDVWWRDATFPCGWEREAVGCAYFPTPPYCRTSVEVLTGPDARDTALAHEVCHVALRSWDEGEADGCAEGLAHGGAP